MNYLFHFGRYILFLGKVFARPERHSIYRQLILDEIIKLGVGSLGIIAIISAFMGLVVTIQTASNIDSAWIPAYTVGFTTRQSIILEFSPTMIALILAGKIGSNIASEIGSMKISEQIDALEIMGINSYGYLVLPKIVAACLINPFLIIISMFIGVFAGYLICFTGVCPPQEYIYGITFDFKPFHIGYALFKTVVFAFIITSVSAYQGYYTKGSALEVGVSSTKAVVYSCVLILTTNYLITQLVLI